MSAGTGTSNSPLYDDWAVELHAAGKIEISLDEKNPLSSPPGDAQVTRRIDDGEVGSTC